MKSRSYFVRITLLVLVVLATLTFVLGRRFIFREQRSIKIGISHIPYPPFHYYVDGELVGLDIDIARAAGDIMDVLVEFVQIDWLAREEALVNNSVDVLMGGLERATLDESRVAFTNSYLRSGIVMVMPRDRDYEQFEDLAGGRVAVLFNTPAYDYFVASRGGVGERSSFTPQEYTALLGIFDDEDYDCLIADTFFANFFNRHNYNAYRVSEILFGISYAAATRADDTELFQEMEIALGQMVTGGMIDSITNAWIR